MPSRVVRPAKAGESVFEVMIFNVNYGLAGDPETFAAICGRDVDLVLLQETIEEWEKAICKDFSVCYPHMCFFYCCGVGGLVVLLKYVICDLEYIEPKSWFFVLRLLVDLLFGEVQVLNVHLCPPFDDDGSIVRGYFSTPKIRREEITIFVARLVKGHPTLIVGDFNENEGGSVIELFEGCGMVMVLSEFHPDADTWRWMTSIGEINSRLDHIVYDPKL